MKVLIEAQRVLRKNKAGMDRVVLNILEELQHHIDDNIAFVIVAQDDEDNTCLDHLPFEIIITEKCNYMKWEQTILPEIIEKVQPNIVHFTSNTATLKNLKIPVVITVHDVIYLERSFMECFKGSTYQIMGNFYRKYNVPRVIKRAEKIITVSEFEKENISQYFPLLKNRIKVIHNGVSSRFKEENIINKENLYGEYFFHLGNTEPRKNTRGVIRAFGHYKKQLLGSAKLAINGVDKSIIEKWLAEDKNQDVADEIIHLGFIKNQDLPNIYHHALSLLFPSFREGFGMPPLEAMLAGSTVITSRYSSIPEVCGDAAHYIDPYDFKSMALGMKTIENDPVYRSKLIEKGAVNALDFSWEAAAQKTIDIYKSI